MNVSKIKKIQFHFFYVICKVLMFQWCTNILLEKNQLGRKLVCYDWKETGDWNYILFICHYHSIHF